MTLRNPIAWLAAIIESSDDAIISKTLDGVITSWNPAAARIFGYTAEEAVGQLMLIIFPPDRQNEEKDILARIAAGEHVQHFHTVRMRRDGRLIDVSVSISPIKDADGKVVGASKIARDITLLMQRERELARLSRLYAALSQVNQAIVWTPSREELLPKICRVLVEHGGFRMAWIGWRRSDDGTLDRVAQWGDQTRFLERLSNRPDGRPDGQGPTGTAFREGRPYICNDLKTDPVAYEWRHAAIAEGIHAMAAFPIREQGVVKGTLTVYADEPFVFLEREIALLAEAALDTSFALDNLHREEAKRIAEETRRTTEARYRTLFEYAPDGIIIADPRGIYLEVNSSLCTMLGYERSEIVGKSAASFVVPEELAHIEPALSRIHSANAYSRRWRFRRKDGSAFSADVIATTMPDGNILAMIRDVTERERAEAAIRESEQRFRELAENISEVFWITDPNKNKMLYVSPAYEPIWGRTCEELYASPMTWVDTIHPDDREHVIEAARTNQVAGTYDETYRIVRTDGAVRWIRDRAFPVVNKQGELYRVVGTAQDVTDRKVATERVEEQAALLDQTQDAILVRDLHHRILYWNRGAERIYGWTKAEAIGQSVVELLYRNHDAHADAISAVMAEGFWSGEIDQVTKTGEAVTIESRWALMRDEHGAPRSVLTVNTDITQRKKLEEQFLRAQRMESVGRMAGGIAHDLNNVLAPILMSTEILRKEVAPGNEELVDTIRASAQRGADLIKQVLSFSRGLDGERIAVDALPLIADLITVTRETFPRSIVIRLDPGEGGSLIQGDPTQLHQVFLNLLVNARDAMPNGGRLTISIENVTVDETYAAMHFESRPGRYVKITVADTGVGIPAEIRSQIFEPFFTTKDFGIGTGLGLSTTLGIVKNHGGFINLYSEVGNGTQFAVYLPAISADDALAASPNSRLPPGRGHGELVLLVDDEDAIRQVAQRTLEEHGYRVVPAAHGAEAVSTFARLRKEIDIVLTDMAMPVMDGSALIVALRTIDPLVKVIASSGLADQRPKTVEARVDRFLQKPYTAETMLRAIEAVLAEGR